MSAGDPSEAPTGPCPRCGSPRVRPILYGYPAPEGIEAIERGEVITGGCMVSGSDPTHGCLDCDARFFVSV